MPPALSIIIVTYNSAEVIEDCLRSIPQGWAADCSDGVCKPADTSNWDGSEVETIVVDNGSTDDTVKIVTEKFKWAKVLSGQGNLMFSGGNNYGFKHAAAPFMFMLNPDTIVQAGALRMPLHQFIIATLSGKLIKMWLAAYAGAGAFLWLTQIIK